MASVLRNIYRSVACLRYLPGKYRSIVGNINEFSTTTASRKDPKFDEIFRDLRKTTRLRADEYAQIEEYVKKDLTSDIKEEGDQDKLNQMFNNEDDDPTAYEDNNDEVSNQFWENAFSSYNMKKLDAPEKPKKLKQTFMNMGEAEPWEQDGMLPDDDDDLTSLGHGQLELHRELRHYARLAAWEMPLLYKLRKPFNPPSEDTPLRFRYTTYLGEQHPAENKVVLEFCPLDILDLTSIERDKLRKLAGVRWNPQLDIVKMSCESYPTQAQNKRYLGDVLASLLKEAKDAKDTMNDIPFNTKYHTFKSYPQFPQEWVMTKERQDQLEKQRKILLKKDENLKTKGLLVDGSEQILKMLNGSEEKTEGAITNDMLMVGEENPVSKIAVKR